MSNNPSDSFAARQRQHVGRVMADYGDKIAGLLRMMEADAGVTVVDADREVFCKDEGHSVYSAVAFLRSAALECYMLADDLAGVDVEQRVLAIAPPPSERNAADYQGDPFDTEGGGQ